MEKNLLITKQGGYSKCILGQAPRLTLYGSLPVTNQTSCQIGLTDWSESGCISRFKKNAVLGSKHLA